MSVFSIMLLFPTVVFVGGLGLLVDCTFPITIQFLWTALGAESFENIQFFSHKPRGKHDCLHILRP
jgi:hypothetical protein